jgi:hypothetical protein
MMNDGKGNFKVLNTQQSGIRLNGMVRDIVKINIGKEKGFLILQNGEAPVLFKLTQAPMPLP